MQQREHLALHALLGLLDLLGHLALRPGILLFCFGCLFAGLLVLRPWSPDAAADWSGDTLGLAA